MVCLRMAKRQRRRVEEFSNTDTPLRRSPRFARTLRSKEQRQRHPQQQLPTPAPSHSPATQKAVKKRSLEVANDGDTGPSLKRPRGVQSSGPAPSLLPDDRVAHWVYDVKWPAFEMSKADTVHAPNPRKRGSSSHPSERRKRLEENGIYMKTSVLLKEESKKFCEGLSTGQHRPALLPCYPASKLEDVLERVHELNEARLQRDIMPWIVPSAENLHFSGAIDGDYIGEEVDTEWSRCETMGSSKPKPDFAAGLKRSAFSTEENVKLQNYSTVQHPYLFTRDLAFPFLMCEAKTGRVGLDHADTQNVHSASIATRAILSLYISTFGRDHEDTRDLFGRILVFTVSHNNRVVNLYGHYAVPNTTDGQDSFTYFRHDIAMFSLTLYEGKERFKAYAFIRNLYDKFAPQHLGRIRKAVKAMPKPTARTGLSFAASDITLEEEGSQAESGQTSQSEEAFKVPSEPASASQHRELANVRVQLDSLLQQMDQQKEDSRQQLEESRKQIEKQQEESKKREEALERRLDKMMELVSKSGK